MQSPLGQELLGINTTSVGVPNVNASNMAMFTFPLPPVAEQERILSTIELLMAQCGRVKARLADSRTVHERLADALAQGMMA